MLRPVALAVLSAAVLSLACGGGPSGPPTVSGISVLSGNNQEGPVGAALPLPITVQVSSSHGGGFPNTTVTFAIVSGGGSLSRTTATTDATGQAQVNWSLGPDLGAQQIRVSAGPSASATVSATARVGPAAFINPTAGNSQFAVVNTPVAIAPRIVVGDAFGNPISGLAVTFLVADGGGAVVGGSQVTDATGHATLGSWTLGPGAGLNRLIVTAGELSTAFIATGTPAIVTPSAGNNQTANQGTLTPIRPAVRALDGNGNPLANVSVIFNVATGGGFVLGPNQVTDPTGVAQVGGWVLGPGAGANTLQAIIGGLSPVSFSATGQPAVAAAITAQGPTAFGGVLGNFLGGLPAVRLTDASGNPVGAQLVEFSATTGDGQVAGASGVSDYDGRVAVGAWRLGGAAANQTLQAATQGLPPVVFTATAGPVPPQEFTIEVRFRTTPTANQRAAFDNAVARWQQIIRGDIPDIPLQVPASTSGCYPELNETIDDLVIYADLVPIDGVGNVLGSAGPCLIRTTGRLPIVGRMRFDTADLDNLESTGRLEAVILHEMGHVLGIGTIWSSLGLLIGSGSSDPWFNGPASRGAFAMSAVPRVFAGNTVPVEATGGSGTAFSHWRESTMDTELMTGFLDQGFNPLSAVTAASMRDMGYVVDDAVSDAYTLPAFLRTLGTPKYQLREAPLEGPVYTVNRQGRIDGILFR